MLLSVVLCLTYGYIVNGLSAEKDKTPQHLFTIALVIILYSIWKKKKKEADSNSKDPKDNNKLP